MEVYVTLSLLSRHNGSKVLHRKSPTLLSLGWHEKFIHKILLQNSPSSCSKYVSLIQNINRSLNKLIPLNLACVNKNFLFYSSLLKCLPMPLKHAEKYTSFFNFKNFNKKPNYTVGSVAPRFPILFISVFFFGSFIFSEHTLVCS